MGKRPGGLYEASESESDWEGLYGGGGADGDDDEEGEQSDDSMGSFIDDDDSSEVGSDSEEDGMGEEGAEGAVEDGEEEVGDDDDDDDDADDDDESSHGLSSPEGSDIEDDEGGVVRASCLLEGDWEPRALLRIECLRGRTPTVELSFELQGERLARWSKARRLLDDLRWG